MSGGLGVFTLSGWGVVCHLGECLGASCFMLWDAGFLLFLVRVGSVLF